MRLIEPSFEIWEQPAGLEGIYKRVEHVGRVCYKSEDKITEDSAKPFVERMIKSGHGAMLEHGTVYLQFKGIIHCFGIGYQVGLKYLNNPYSKVALSEKGATQYVTTNYRVLVEKGWLDDLRYLCAPTEYHEKRVTVHLILDRGVAMEFIRHRKFSFSMESTRYCNYSKDKFDNGITYIIPSWLNISEGIYSWWGTHWRNLTTMEDIGPAADTFLESLNLTENSYLELIQNGWKPEQARAVLPNALKTELVMTGFVDDWKKFFELRDSNKAHPQARELASPLHKEFIEKGLIK